MFCPVGPTGKAAEVFLGVNHICRASMGSMAGTVYVVAASLDGFIADARNSGELLREFSGAGAEVGGAAANFGAVAMGAETYRSFVSSPNSWPYGTLPAWVFTHREFEGIPGADITFVRGEAAEFHADIQWDAGEQGILLCGGGNLAAQFMDSGLMDEMVLMVLPVVLGSGRPVLPVRRATGKASLVEGRSMGQGAVLLHYRFQS